MTEAKKRNEFLPRGKTTLNRLVNKESCCQIVEQKFYLCDENIEYKRY